MEKIALAILLGFCSLTAEAALHTGRSLPRGEESPQVIAKAFSSKAGEVHFLEERGQLGRALLITPQGQSLSLIRTEGPRECDRFGEQAIPGCSFFFSDGSDAIEVLSQDLEEQSLFQAVNHKLQAQARHVTL